MPRVPSCNHCTHRGNGDQDHVLLSSHAPLPVIHNNVMQLQVIRQACTRTWRAVNTCASVHMNAHACIALEGCTWLEMHLAGNAHRYHLVGAGVCCQSVAKVLTKC
jgi:hypothetical protein